MEEQEKADRSRGIFVLHCYAVEITWAHQRRKRRENLRKGNTQVNTNDRQSDSVDEVATQCMRVTSMDMETQEAPEEVDKEEKNAPVCANTDETLTSSFACASKLLDSKERPSASVSIDPQQNEGTSRPLVSFMVRVGTGAEIAADLPRDSFVLEMMWIDGQNKNDLYQLFQFFQNKFLKGL